MRHHLALLAFLLLYPSKPVQALKFRDTKLGQCLRYVANYAYRPSDRAEFPINGFNRKAKPSKREGRWFHPIFPQKSLVGSFLTVDVSEFSEGDTVTYSGVVVGESGDGVELYNPQERSFIELSRVYSHLRNVRAKPSTAGFREVYPLHLEYGMKAGASVFAVVSYLDRPSNTWRTAFGKLTRDLYDEKVHLTALGGAQMTFGPRDLTRIWSCPFSNALRRELADFWQIAEFDLFDFDQNDPFLR